jgi:carbamoyl-phosphate synthase large subunit
MIRRRAVDAGIPLITDLKLAGAVVGTLRSKRPHELGLVAWGDYMERGSVPLK